MLNSKFMENLVVVMKNQKLTRKDLADKSGVATKQLSAHFSRKYNPSPVTKQKICEAINIPLEVMEHETIKIAAPEIDYEPVQRRLAKNLTFQLSQNNMTITELTIRTGISPTTIKRYLNCGAMSPSLANIGTIARALGISVGKLLE